MTIDTPFKAEHRYRTRLDVVQATNDRSAYVHSITDHPTHPLVVQIKGKEWPVCCTADGHQISATSPCGDDLIPDDEPPQRDTVQVTRWLSIVPGGATDYQRSRLHHTSDDAWNCDYGDGVRVVGVVPVTVTLLREHTDE